MTIATYFYLAALIAIVASISVVLSKKAVYALLYLVLSLLAVAVCFYLLGAPFAAGLEVIVYAGAILVLFVFAMMMFGLTHDETQYNPDHRGKLMWFGPTLLSSLLLLLLLNVIFNAEMHEKLTSHIVTPQQVGALLYGPYLLAVELASFLLLAGLIAGYHYAKPDVIGEKYD